MNLQSWLILFLVVAYSIFVIIRHRKQVKEGGACGDCAACGSRKACERNHEKFMEYKKKQAGMKESM